MNHRFRLLVAALAVGAGLFSPSPASAHTDSCVSQGIATLSTGLGLPGLHAANTAAFNYNTSIGFCVAGGLLTANGVLTGWCGLSSGNGVTTMGHRFSYVSQGGYMIVTGEVNGSASVTEDIFDAGACINKTAWNFIITGTVELHHPLTGCSWIWNPGPLGMYTYVKTCI